jgi:hypothetical protein
MRVAFRCPLGRSCRGTRLPTQELSSRRRPHSRRSSLAAQAAEEQACPPAPPTTVWCRWAVPACRRPSPRSCRLGLRWRRRPQQRCPLHSPCLSPDYRASLPPVCVHLCYLFRMRYWSECDLGESQLAARRQYRLAVDTPTLCAWPLAMRSTLLKRAAPFFCHTPCVLFSISC